MSESREPISGELDIHMRDEHITALEAINAELLAACEMAVKELADLRPPNVKPMNVNGCQNPHVADKLKAAIANAQRGE